MLKPLLFDIYLCFVVSNCNALVLMVSFIINSRMKIRVVNFIYNLKALENDLKVMTPQRRFLALMVFISSFI